MNQYDYRKEYQSAQLHQGGPVLAVGGALGTTETGSQIRDSVGGSESCLTDLHQAIDVLDKRLDTVLTPVPPRPVETSQTPLAGVPNSHLLSRTRQVTDGIQAATRRLMDLVQRIEI